MVQALTSSALQRSPKQPDGSLNLASSSLNTSTAVAQKTADTGMFLPSHQAPPDSKKALEDHDEDEDLSVEESMREALASLKLLVNQSESESETVNDSLESTITKLGTYSRKRCRMLHLISLKVAV